MSCNAPKASFKAVFQATGAVALALAARQIEFTVQTINELDIKVSG